MNPAPRPQPAVVKSSSLSSSSVPGKSSAPRTPSSSSRPSQSSFGGHRHLVSGSSKKRRTKNSDDELDAESKPLGRTVLYIMNISNSFLKMTSFLQSVVAAVVGQHTWQLFWKFLVNNLLKKDYFFKWAFRVLFFIIFVFSIQLNVNVKFKFLPMTGFKLRTSGIKSDLSANWPTITAQERLFMHAEVSLGKYYSYAIAFPLKEKLCCLSELNSLNLTT